MDVTVAVTDEEDSTVVDERKITYWVSINKMIIKIIITLTQRACLR